MISRPSRFLLSLGVLASVGLALASCSSVSADEGQDTPSTPAAATPGEGTLIIAHRGGSEEGAEGSVDALAEAARDGFPAEFDLRALADGEWAVAHDADVERILESGEGPVSELTSEQWLKSCIRQEGDAQDSDGCKHPALWTDLVGDLPDSAVLVPELKQKTILVDEFIDSVRDLGITDRVVVQSFSGRETRRLASEGLHVLQLVGKCDDLDLQEIVDTGIEYLGVSTKCDVDVVSQAHAKGLSVWVWTINEVEQAQDWVDAGVDGIFSDAPRRLEEGLDLDA